MNALFELLLIVLFIVFCYFTVILLIMLWTGCNSTQAQKRLHNLINGKVQTKMESDMGLANEIWDNVRKIIGDDRFKQLQDLNTTTIYFPLLFFGNEGKTPYIAVSVYFKDDAEKKVLENVIKNVVIRYLQSYGYCTTILSTWKQREDLQMPYLEIKYSRDDEEWNALAIQIRERQNAIAINNKPIKDTTEDVDLNGPLEEEPKKNNKDATKADATEKEDKKENE